MDPKRLLISVFFLVCVCVCCSFGQTTTETPEQACASLNASCEECVKNPHCLWCPTRPDTCSAYPSGKILPPSDYCRLDDARWGVCWVNYKVLLICMGIIASALFLSISCCCIYCCCCKSNGRMRRRLEEDDKRYERESNERKEKHTERRKERETKYDEIRKKYGLTKEENPYQRFDEEEA